MTSRYWWSLCLAIFLVCLPASVVQATEITVGVEAGGPYSLFYKDLSKEFTALTGIKVNFLEIPHDSMHQRFLTEAIAGTGAIDVYQADQPWVAEFAALGFLEPLSRRISREDLSDFFPTALATVTYRGEIYALPYLVHNSVLYYRTDLFKAAGLAEPPATWDQYRSYALKLTNRNADIYGTVVEGKEHIEAAAKFLDVLYQAGGSVLDEKGTVTFDSQATLDAFRFMLTLQYEDRTSPPGAPGYDNADVHNLFMQGKLAMAPNWPYMYAMASDPSISRVAGQFGIALQPGKAKREAAVFSWGYAVSSASRNKEAAWQFVRWATSKDVLVRLGKAFTNPVARMSAFGAVMADPGVGAAQRDAIAVMTRSVEVSRSIPMVPQWPAIHERIARALSRIMTRQATPEAEVKAAQADLVRILGQ